MTFTVRALGLAAVGCVTVLLAMRGGGVAPATKAAIAIPAEPVASPVAAAPAGVAAPGRSHEQLVSYAVALNELHGLPPRAAPGTQLELWVAWEPPVTKRPRIHRLLDRVILEEIAPPLLPDGPQVATLLVRPKEVSDLLYGDRYGSLSVTIPQT